jgi:hypothetical protein
VDFAACVCCFFFTALKRASYFVHAILFMQVKCDLEGNGIDDSSRSDSMD